ncbi:MAG: glycosyltransferase family 2 protein [Lachnospiraceae bacterium]|nr:glycosyltransferase family 2 protein [Lachnospiraceae bacterium]
MFFSIIVPVYNVEKYINECLASISKQDFKDYEVILVDDGSTDNSGYICDEYAKNHNNVKVIHKKNEGLLLARRTGIKSATGEYFLHCDSDDYLCKNALSEIYEAIQSINPDMVMFGYNVVDDEHNVIENHYDVFEDRKIITDSNKEELYKELVSTTWINNMWTKVTKRSCVDIDADYSEYRNICMGEDLIQVMPLFYRCDSICYIRKPLYGYRFNPNGISKQLDEKYIQQYMKVSVYIKKSICMENVSESTMVLFYNRYVKDIHKYLLRILKRGKKYKEYLELYNMINEDCLYKESIEKCGKNLMVRNRVLLFMIKPRLYYITSLVTKTLLSGKL